MPPDRGRAGGTETDPAFVRAKNWVLLNGYRGGVAAVVSAAVFAVLAAVALSPLSPLRDVQPMYYVLGGLVSGNLTIITVVVSINQLLLSRELKTPNELRSQMEGVVDYRRDVEDAADRVAPVEPLGFLRLLHQSTRRQAQRLGGVATAEAGDAADEIDAVVSEVTEQTDRVDALLEGRNASTFHALSTTLSTNYARDINRLRRIKWRHGDALPAEVTDAIDGLIDRLQHIDVARQYFKTVYIETELASLSRLLFYAGLPSVTVVAAVFFLLTAAGDPSASRAQLAVLLAGTITVGLFPLVVLSSFILRTATVTKRTAATLPFTTPRQEE